MDAHWLVAAVGPEPIRTFFTYAACDPFHVQLLPWYTERSDWMPTGHAQRGLPSVFDLTFQPDLHALCKAPPFTKLLRKCD